MSAPDGGGRRPRADGQRNRARLLDAARAAFDAGDPAVALDEVARRAGVGIGTLYRHFPTRAALIEALYRARVEALAEEADRLTAERPPLEALRAWLLLFVEYLTNKRLITAALAAEGGADAPIGSGERVRAVVRALGGRAAVVGALDPALDPVDLLRALTGVLHYGDGSDAAGRARRLVDILLAGAAPAGAPPPGAAHLPPLG